MRHGQPGQSVRHLIHWLGRRWVATILALGIILAVANIVVFTGGFGAASHSQNIVLGLDALFILLLSTAIAWRVVTLLVARRRRSQGTRLHLRLAAIFAFAAFVPTLLVALFAAFTLDVWLENLFSDRIGSVLRNSLVTAEAYEREHRDKIRADVSLMAADLNRFGRQGVRLVS